MRQAVLTKVASEATTDDEEIGFWNSWNRYIHREFQPDSALSVDLKETVHFLKESTTMPILAVLFGFLSLNTAALLFLAVYILITLSDLDCDYLNPTACSAKLNKWIIPEMISYGINVVIIAFAGRFILVMLNLPMLIYVIYSFFFSVPSKSMGFYDPSEIYLHGKLKTHIKFASIRLVFHLVHFFIYLYIFIISLLTSV